MLENNYTPSWTEKYSDQRKLTPSVQTLANNLLFLFDKRQVFYIDFILKAKLSLCYHECKEVHQAGNGTEIGTH